jgi:hypothetical protein
MSHPNGNAGSDDPGYVGAWRRYRTWARIRLIAFLGGLPYGIAVTSVTKSLGIEHEVPTLILPWFILFGVGLIGAGLFECPRCKKFFFFTWFLSNPFVSRCLHCGLPKWAMRNQTEGRRG